MKLFLINLLSIACVVGRGQASISNDSLLIGTWKGSSTCQVRPSPCHDEINVYHITRTDKQHTYHVVANKVVSDKEEDMGAYDCTFDGKSKTLSCWDEQNKIAWKFQVTDHRMEGTLVYQGKIYRIIKLAKAGSN